VPRIAVFSPAKFGILQTLILCATATRSNRSRSRSAKQSADADVFVDSRPVNTFTTTDQTKLGSFFNGGIEKPREPDKWNADAAAVGERNRELILRRLHVSR
jgi:hypothetical protein